MERKHHFQNLWKRKSTKETSGKPANTEINTSPLQDSKSFGLISRLGSPFKGHFGTASRHHSAQAHADPPQISYSGPRQNGRSSHKHSQSAVHKPVQVPATSVARPTTAPASSSVPTLHLNKMDLNLSEDLKHMTLGDKSSLLDHNRKTYDKDAAERNTSSRTRAVDVLDHSLPGYPRVSAEKSRYSEDVAQRNLGTSSTSRQNGVVSQADTGSRPYTGAKTHPSLLEAATSGDDASKHNRNVSSGTYGSIPRKPLPNEDHSKSTQSHHAAGLNQETTTDAPTYTSQGQRERGLRHKQSLNPLNGANEHRAELENRSGSPVSSLALTNDQRTSSTIPRPLDSAASTRSSIDRPVPHQSKGHSNNANIGLRDKFAKQSLVEAGIDLRNTTDTEVTTKWAPAVTHETVKPVVREVRQEQITRDIHTHDVYHRILPIKEVEVLPARHFIQSHNGERVEVNPKSIPCIAGSAPSWRIVGPEPSNSHESIIPQKFTARTFEGTEGDYVERAGQGGVKNTETTWVHPPTLEYGPMEKALQGIPSHSNNARRDMPGGWV